MCAGPDDLGFVSNTVIRVSWVLTKICNWIHVHILFRAHWVLHLTKFWIYCKFRVQELTTSTIKTGSGVFLPQLKIVVISAPCKVLFYQYLKEDWKGMSLTVAACVSSKGHFEFVWWIISASVSICAPESLGSVTSIKELSQKLNRKTAAAWIHNSEHLNIF